MSEQPFVPRVIIDTRELPGGLPRTLSLMNKCYLELKELEVGDIVLSDEVAGERKREDDFLKSLLEERKLLGQLYDLKNAYKKPFLIIEGYGDGDVRDMIYTARRINPVSLRGVLIAIQLSLGVQIFWTNSIEESAQLIVHIATTEQNTTAKRYFNPHGKRSHMKPREQLVYTLSSLPDTGVKTAKNLLTHFKTLQAIANADEEQLKEVDLVGDKTAVALKEFFRREY